MVRLLGELGAAATPGVDDVATTGGDTALQQVSLLQKRAPMAGRCCMGEGTRVLQGVAACRGGVAEPGAASERGMAAASTSEFGALVGPVCGDFSRWLRGEEDEG